MRKNILVAAYVCIVAFGFSGIAQAETIGSNAQIRELQATIERLQAEIKLLQAKTVNGDVLTTRLSDDKMTFSRSLGVGMRGDDVRKLQEVLATDSGIYPEKLQTGFFGEKTKEAIERLQEKFEIKKTGMLDETTIELINKILASYGATNIIPPGLLITPGLKDRVKTKLEMLNGVQKYKIEIADEKLEFKNRPVKNNKLEIEIERKGNRSKAKVDMRGQFGRIKRVFIFNTTDTEEIVKELANKLSLSRQEIENAINSSSDDSTDDNSNDDDDDGDDDSNDDNGDDSGDDSNDD